MGFGAGYEVGSWPICSAMGTSHVNQIMCFWNYKHRTWLESSTHTMLLLYGLSKFFIASRRENSRPRNEQHYFQIIVIMSHTSHTIIDLSVQVTCLCALNPQPRTEVIKRPTSIIFTSHAQAPAHVTIYWAGCTLGLNSSG